MKRIDSIEQLNDEKKQLKKRQVELEKAIVYDWQDLKTTVQPKAIAGRIFSKTFSGNGIANRSSIASVVLSEIAGKYAGILLEKAGKYISSRLKK